MELRDQNGLTEREFLEAYAKKSYPRPYLTADVVLLSNGCDVLLVRRKGHPCIGRWAFPGGFVNPTESAFDAALRELKEETGVETASDLHEIGLFSRPGRDPRGWVVTDAYLAEIDRSRTRVQAGDDAADAAWFRVSLDGGKPVSLTAPDGTTLDPDALAFDHAEILARAFELHRSLQHP